MVTAIELAIGLLIIGVIVYSWRGVDGQRRTLARVRDDGLGYLCLPVLGQTGTRMWILAVGPRDITLGRATRTGLAVKRTIPVAGARIGPGQIRVNGRRPVDGLTITSATGEDVRVALYTDPTRRASHPLRGPELDAAITAISAAVRAPA